MGYNDRLTDDYPEDLTVEELDSEELSETLRAQLAGTLRDTSGFNWVPMKNSSNK